ncbi:hypothetical protein V7S43_011199 [Phytophthora oleae]|uniref:HAT C-terminal dimerisation domain-containing protein n=1 Tax=Phytophthora oleae TaxID=2107226 RepID=A0ABD3FCX6_9STRA
MSQSAADRNFWKVKNAITNKARALMRSVAETTEDDQLLVFPQPPPVVFSEDLMEMFSGAPAETTEPENQQQDKDDNRIDEELQRWMIARTTLRQTEGGRVESILSYWKRQELTSTYKLLPRVARIIYAMPVSSTQIERDFGTAGRMVTP